MIQCGRLVFGKISQPCSYKIFRHRYTHVKTYSRLCWAKNNYILTEAEFYQIMGYLVDMSVVSKQEIHYGLPFIPEAALKSQFYFCPS